MSQRPVVVGLLLCEQHIVEERTRNVTLVNCFTKKRVEQFPSEPQRFTVYAALTDGLGEVALTVVIERLDDNEEIFRRSHSVRFTDPLQEVRFVVRVLDCSFPTAGAYEVSLSVGGELMAQHRFLVQ